MAHTKARQAAALALVVWYLMRPPVPHLGNKFGAHATRDKEAPLSRWAMLGTFHTEKECEAHRGSPWERCVASDDPRLKRK